MPETHVDDEERDLPHLADDRDERERKTIETIARRIGTSEATTAPKTSSSTINAAGRPKSSPSFKILVREPEEIVVGGELARDRDLVRTAIGLLHDVDHILDPVLRVVAHPDREHGRVLVR